jgi:hypothetical protein
MLVACTVRLHSWFVVRVWSVAGVPTARGHDQGESVVPQHRGRGQAARGGRIGGSGKHEGTLVILLELPSRTDGAAELDAPQSG